MSGAKRVGWTLLHDSAKDRRIFQSRAFVIPEESGLQLLKPVMTDFLPHASPATIAQSVRALEPWITKFTVLGETYGGTYDGLNDDRVSRLPQFFPRCRRILEVGCLEGAHTVVLSRGFPYTDIVALDGRAANLERARFLTSLYGCRRVDFGVADLENADLTAYGKFDVCVCVGLLYHLWEPWKFLRRVGAQAEGLWLWTVICDEASAEVVRDGYRGRIYAEGPLSDALSALRAQSFFPTLGSLTQMLRDAGFNDVHAMNFETTPNGPSVSLVCKKETYRFAGQ